MSEKRYMPTEIGEAVTEMATMGPFGFIMPRVAVEIIRQILDDNARLLELAKFVKRQEELRTEVQNKQLSDEEFYRRVYPEIREIGEKLSGALEAVRPLLEGES